MHVLTLSGHLEWQVAPAGEEAPAARGNLPRVGYPAGSMVELFHPDHDTEIAPQRTLLKNIENWGHNQ